MGGVETPALDMVAAPFFYDKQRGVVIQFQQISVLQGVVAVPGGPTS